MFAPDHRRSLPSRLRTFPTSRFRLLFQERAIGNVRISLREPMWIASRQLLKKAPHHEKNLSIDSRGAARRAFQLRPKRRPRKTKRLSSLSISRRAPMRVLQRAIPAENVAGQLAVLWASILQSLIFFVRLDFCERPRHTVQNRKTPSYEALILDRRSSLQCIKMVEPKGIEPSTS